jgi:aryl-phospho-beta-D-glucosidase BglC (GH1 family)
MSAYSNIASANPSSFGDSSPPTAPSNLVAGATSSSQIVLGWASSTDDVGVTGYLIQRCQGAGCANFMQFDTSATTAYVDNTAAAATSYSYLVQAMDAAGNMSLPSNSASAVTSSPPDTNAPTAPLNLTGILFSSTQMNLSWTASTDDVGVTGYLIERCQGVNCTNFAQIGASTLPAYSDQGVVPGTSYSYRVRATDASGNLSTYSNIFFWSGLSIQAQSNHLIDALGNVVQLRGVNISGLEFVAINNGTTAKDPWGGQTGTAVPQWSTIATGWRANAVRLTLNEASWLGYTCINNKGVSTNPDPWGNYQATVQQSVTSANAAGLYVILDLHWNAPGSICPQSQVQMADQDHALAFWSSVANTFKGNPAVLFDLFNEPNIGSGTLGYPSGADYWAIWLNGGTTTLLRNINNSITINTVPWTSVGMNQLIAAVRATGATNVLLIGGLGGAGDLSGWLSHAPTDPLSQMALSWHAYPAAAVANEGGFAQAVIGAGIPVVIGETGDKSSNGTTSTPTLSSVLTWADANQASVLPWTWNDWSSTGGSADLLIKDALGTPTDGEGVNYKAWLAAH